MFPDGVSDEKYKFPGSTRDTAAMDVCCHQSCEKVGAGGAIHILPWSPSAHHIHLS